MMLIEDVPVADQDLPVAPFKDHLRLGTGFTETNIQDSVLIGFLRAALSTIEGRTAKALYRRDFTLTQEHWSSAGSQTLPLAPAASVNAVTMVHVDASETLVAPERYRLVADLSYPVLRATGACLPTIPSNAIVRIEFTAGFAADWVSMPPDLAQAVMLLAAHYYEYRDETALGEGCMPFGVTSLIQRYRPMRLTPGRAV